MPYILFYSWVMLLALGMMLMTAGIRDQLSYVLLGIICVGIALWRLVSIRPFIRHYWAQLMIAYFLFYIGLLITRDVIKGTF